MLAERGDDVSASGRGKRARARARSGTARTSAFFPGYALPPSVRVTADLGAAVADAALVLVVVPTTAYRRDAVPARALRAGELPHRHMQQGHRGRLANAPVGGAGERASAREALQRSLYLSGPSFADEVARRLPTNVVLAGFSFDLSVEVQQRIATDRFRVYSSDDPIGVQVGGALKNVIAIAAGACDGLGFGYNTRAALITRGLAEMARLAVEKGGQEHTLAGLSGPR